MYILTSILFLLFGFIAVYFLVKRKAEKQLKKSLVLNWGKPKPLSEFYRSDLIKRFSELQDADAEEERLTPQTQEDLDIFELFVFLDRSTSKIGQQFLFDKIIRPSRNQKSLDALEKRIQFFAKNPAIRLKVQEQLLRLSKEEHYALVALLDKPLLRKHKGYPLLIADSILLLIASLLLPFYPAVLPLVLILLIVNMGLYFWNKGNLMVYTRSLPPLRLLLKCAKKLVKESIPYENRLIEKDIDSLAGLQHKISWLSFEDGTSDVDPNQLLKYLLDLFKAFFLIEIHVLYAVIDQVMQERTAILRLFQFIGSIDADIAIASLRSGLVNYSIPTFSEKKKEMELVGVYHPLIADCVPNSLYIKHKSVLITGSNMSGKSSFLRTVAVNMIVAQTLHTCFGQTYCAPFYEVYTSFHLRDDLLNGKSYYKAEVELIAALVRLAAGGQPCLFLLDEVFKGTNTLERLGAAKAVLHYLNQQEHLVLVATHDVELAAFLASEYEDYHFEEEVQEGELVFDHKIKRGALQNSNAIKILDISDFPKEIIDDANRTVQLIRDKTR